MSKGRKSRLISKTEILEMYLREGETSQTVGEAFGISSRYVNMIVRSFENVEVKEKVDQKISKIKALFKGTRKVKSSKISKYEFLRMAPREISKRKLIDLYVEKCDENNITVAALVNLARENGIKVIG